LTQEATIEDAEKTDGSDRDLVHGDGGAIGLPVKPGDLDKDDEAICVGRSELADTTKRPRWGNGAFVKGVHPPFPSNQTFQKTPEPNPSS
jgi:hypothetical protein